MNSQILPVKHEPLEDSAPPVEEKNSGRNTSRQKYRNRNIRENCLARNFHEKGVKCSCTS